MEITAQIPFAQTAIFYFHQVSIEAYFKSFEVARYHHITAVIVFTNIFKIRRCFFKKINPARLILGQSEINCVIHIGY
jgi:hypothetical protein